MKAAFSLMALGLASLAAATDYHNNPPVETVYQPGYPVKTYTTKIITKTSTTLCPITTTVYEHGSTITKTYLSTSYVITKIPTVIYETVKGPDKTTKVYDEVIVTKTKVYPVTETKTVPGGVETITYTKTSVYVTKVPTTEVEYTTLAPQTTDVVSWEYQTSTSYCPITTIETVSGTPVTVIHTSTSLIVVKVPKTDVQYTTLAPQTTQIVTWDYQTSTSYCPITTIETVSGKPVTVIHTSTSLIVVKVPTTVVKTELVLTTCYLTSVVHETTKIIETEYTTVKAGSTIVIATTLTNTIKVTDEYTITKTLEPPTTKATVYQPITLETSVAVTEIVTKPSEVIATVPGSTVIETIEVPTTITTVPIITNTPPPPPAVTLTTSIQVNSTSAPLQISDNAAATNAPMAFAIAGGMAVLAVLA